MRRMLPKLTLTLAAALGLALAACGSTGSANAPGGSAPTATSAPATAVIQTHSVTIDGKSVTTLADMSGKTLYYFTKDTNGTIACTSQCASLWPPLLVPTGTPGSSASLSGTLAVVTGANGRQVTYNGHPLYTFTRDKDSGDAYGQGFMGIWFVATPDLAAQSSSSGGGGYGG